MIKLGSDSFVIYITGTEKLNLIKNEGNSNPCLPATFPALCKHPEEISVSSKITKQIQCYIDFWNWTSDTSGPRGSE